MALPCSRFICAIVNTLAAAEQAIDAGAGMIQFRHKGEWRAAFPCAQAVRRLCGEAKIPFIINDRVDVALALDGDGVHLGQQDLPIAAARQLIGNKLIGATVSSAAEAREVSGADYIGAGHIFPTCSKEKPYPPIGLETLKEIIAVSRLPVIAIGGINAANAAEVWETGVRGIAVISAIDQIRSLRC